ncbi:MAG TPA: D-aminoacyl-tRNA deacylase [Limnochordia bacterium]|nr:D-aminoacyl-tRNA deacylase [Bacillota bacterium]HOM00052.1 D-aminoacyl-tRNA deacylase [Limnochordia bacterium]HPP71600.1 D-aminoacyl-tRNA deacylase [Limnochordia bacterium]HPZ80237.1 D-aminoacyl-tRNA deacylase [Limnochordia bacterium]HQE36822.1 D-aminoacyl-tRNA deacylase [Limnochordia bacterium]
MRAVVQRVQEASVTVEGTVVGAITHGLLVFLGVGSGDTSADARYLAKKIARLRIFPDDQGKMNLDVQEVGGQILAVSQFTLYGDCRRGRRPSFSGAAAPDVAETLYQEFVAELQAEGITVATGVFQAHMDVSLINDGPVTLIVSSEGE